MRLNSNFEHHVKELLYLTSETGFTQDCYSKIGRLNSTSMKQKVGVFLRTWGELVESTGRL